MSPEVIDDLKQFIEATVHHATADMATQSDLRVLERRMSRLEIGLEKGLQGVENRLMKRINDSQQAIAEAITNQNDDNDARFKNHDRRITKLERRTM